MRYRIYALISAFFAFFLNIYGSYEDLFNTNFLKKPNLVEQYLVNKEGFTSGYFETEDQHHLHYLFKKRDNARATIICSVGFWPGRKEGMATLYAMLPEDCSLLLFDARGRGRSDGFYYSLWRYGIDEYKDIHAAINFVQSQSSNPIILYGICSGAFNTAHALCNKQPQAIRGLIMDSAWSSVTQVSHTALKSELKKYWRSLIETQISNQRAKNFLYTTCSYATDMSTYLLHRLVFIPVLYAYRDQTDLIAKIHKISIPILYIHSRDDSYTKSNAVEELIAHTQKSYSWWIYEHSSHAAHHLKHATAYKNKLTEFINLVLS
jgi:pimeloyl-ACP methyl ester carboxylesterase